MTPFIVDILKAPNVNRIYTTIIIYVRVHYQGSQGIRQCRKKISLYKPLIIKIIGRNLDQFLPINV